jgi:tetratricopeptide (TPR) repeat protein
MPIAKENVLKALDLDPNLSSAHLSLGHIEFNYEWNWKKGREEFQKAIELNPSNSLAYLLNGMTLASKGNKEEALNSFRKLNELDPGYSPATIFPIGIAYYWMRDYDGALNYFQKTLEMDKEVPSPNFWMGLTYLEKKDYPRAMEVLQRAADITHDAPVALMGLGIGYARQGNIKKSEMILSQLLDQTRKTYIPEFYLACLYANMGRKDEAFDWLNKGFEARASGMPILRAVPLVDALRSDPRFKEMLVRMNLQ